MKTYASRSRGHLITNLPARTVFNSGDKRNFASFHKKGKQGRFRQNLLGNVDTPTQRHRD